MKFLVTYEVVTEASAEYGDAAYRGFLPRSGQIPHRNHYPSKPHTFTLRECVKLLAQRSHPLESSEWPLGPDGCRWVTAYWSDDCSGSESINVHLNGITPSTRRRILRLLGFKIGGGAR